MHSLAVDGDDDSSSDVSVKSEQVIGDPSPQSKEDSKVIAAGRVIRLKFI